MKKIALALLLLAAPAHAQIIPALPFQLQNNTVADATQVMADFNQILNSVNLNAAKNGANSDITALLGLTTPITPPGGGTTTFTAPTASGGSANAQTIAAVVPSTFTPAVGSRVGFIAGASNTAATTLNVAATGVKNILRMTQIGLAPLVGGELVAGQYMEVIYDGTSYQLQGRIDQVGLIMDSVWGTAPAGWARANGACISQTGIGATLFTIAATTWGTCSAGDFALPDTRGRMLAALDDGVGRITVGGSGCSGNVLGSGCGAENHVQTTGEMAAHTHGIVDPGHVHNYVQAASSGGTIGAAGSAAISLSAQPTTVNGTGISIVSNGSSTAMPILNPVLIVHKIVKL